MAVLTIVWDAAGPDLDAQAGRANARLGASSDNFIAIWAERDGSLHFTVHVSPELEHVADHIEVLLRSKEWLPEARVRRLPELEPETPDLS